MKEARKSQKLQIFAEKVLVSQFYQTLATLWYSTQAMLLHTDKVRLEGYVVSYVILLQKNLHMHDF